MLSTFLEAWRLTEKTEYNLNFPFNFFFFLGLHLQCMEVPKLVVKSELQLPAYTTATAKPDLSRICNLHHNARSLTH